MPFPSRLLHEGEGVLVDQHPHWITFFKPAVISAATLASIIAGFVIWKSAPTWFGIVLGLLLSIDAIYGFGKYWAWRSKSIVVTSLRIVRRDGVLRHVTRELSVRSIQDVTVKQGLFQRLVGAGTLIIESAGGRDADVIEDVRDPARVQALISRTVESPVAQVPRKADDLGMHDALGAYERLDSLRRQGIITEAEFVEMKLTIGRDARA